MATITRATVETQSPWVEPGRGATARSSRRRRLRGTAVALLAALVCAWAPAPASAQTTVDTPEALTIGGRFGLSGYEIPFTPGDEKDVRAQWYTGVRLSLDIAKVSEDGGRRQVIVTANVSTWGVRLFAPTVIEVTVGKSGDSAVSGTDYRAVPKFNVTIPKARQGGHTSFYLEPLGDAEWEGAEQITIHGRHVTDHTPDPVAGTTLTVTDEGDSPYTGSQVFLSVNPSKVSEADSATTVEVTARSDAQSVSRRVMVTLSDGVATATWGVDYQIVHNFDITLPANAVSATGTFTLTPIQDTLAEGDETITIKGQVDGHDSGVTGTTLTLTDDDAPPAVTLSASPSSVTENGGAKTVTVTATSAAAASNARTVLVAVGNPVKDTATPGTDYATVPNFTITIPANATTATGSFVLTPTNDTTTENAESISIGGAPESAGAAFTVGGTAMTLTDDDALSAVTLSAAPASVSEGADPTTVTVTATAASAVAWARKVRVVLGTGASTATMGVDYKLVPNFDITIAANATSGTGTFTLTPIQDTTNEGNETIAVSGQSPRTTVTGTTVTLADDDIHPPVTLSVSPSSVSEGAGATTVTVTATVTTARASAFGIIATVGGSGDSAVSGTDYSVNPSQFFINVAAGQTSATNTFTLTPTQDTAVEGGETISVSGVTSGTTVTGAAVMLTDDDSYPAVTLSANPSTVGEDAGATSVTVTATATSSVATARTVTVSVGQTGTAASGADYAAVPDFTIAIAANATTGTGTFTLTPTQDTVVEGSETIGVSGSSPSTTVTGTTLTITDDDNYPAVTLSADPASVGEEASATTVTVTATTTSSVATARTVTVSVGGSGTATSGTDYTAVSDFTITIAANATSGTGTFTLTPTQDTTYEGNETIGVAGTSPSTTVTGTTLTLIDDELPTITLSHWPNNPINEWSAQNYTITATRPESAKGSAVSVTVSVGAGDDETINYATPGTDYHTVPDFTITIAANATSGSANVRISAIRDSHYEGFEWFWFSGTATGYKVTGTGMYIIDDQLPSVVLTASPSSVSEGASATQVTVTAKAQENLGSAYTVTVRVGGSQTATSGTDYAAVSNFTITIPGNGTGAMGTFTLTPTDDILIEGDETISVWGSTNGLSVVGTTLTLTDDDQPTIALSASPSSVSEGASATQVTVTATAVAAKSTARTVTVSVGDTGTATSGTDYAAVSDFDITIAANATSGTGTFTLTPTQDTAVESNETIGVAGASANTNVAGTTLTLTDDENPAVTLSANPSSVSEGASATSVTVTATAVSAMTTARTVTVSVGDGGTATSGTDYAAVSDFDITIATNATSGTGTFTLTPTQDAANEGDETVGVSGTSTGATVTGTTITLTDIDLPRITLETVPANLRVVENATQSSVIVRATTAAPVKAETTVTLTVGASGDGATKTTDYTASNVGTITLRANGARGEASFDLTPVQDTLVENDETISVSGSSSGGHTVTGTSLTLIDDDSYPAVTLSAAPSSVGEGASATSVTVTATAKSAMSSARTVTVSVGDTGTATSGTDYAAVSDFTVTIAANAKTGTGTFTLTPTQDTTVEGSETIGVAGTSTQSTVTGTTVTLTDDDSYPAITLSANPSSVGEGAIGTATLVTVTASSSAMSSARTVTVSVGGSGTATRGTDYATVADFTVTIAANATSGTGTFNLTPTQDTAVEGSETVGVAGASPSSTVTGTTVTLTDDDTHAIDLSASPSTVAEDKTSETITVTATINAARTAATTVTVSVGDSGDQAKSGTDYKAVSDFTVTIAANKTSGTGTFTFEPKTDTAYEGLESVTISGTTSQSGGGGAAAFGASAANSANASTGIPVTDTSLSIHDASNYPSVTLSANPASVGEGASATSVTVTATATSAIASSREVTVSVGDSGTATSGTDYTAVTDFIIKIAANKKSGTGTFTLTPTQDNVVEGSETISVSATSLSTSVTGTTVTLTDDDRATVTVNDANANEGSDMTFTVTLNRAVVGGLTVTPGYTNVTASSSDYTANTTGISFSGNANETQTFTVSTTQDTVVEDSETFTVGLSVSGTTLTGSITSTDTGTGTINAGTGNNLDTATLTINDASASEGDGISFTVTLSEAVQGGLTVTPGYTHGTHGTAAKSDYSTNTNALSFTGTKGESKTFTVSTTEDAVLEANETFTVGLTVSGTTLTHSITSTDTGTGTINNDDRAAVTVNDASASEGDDITFTVTLSEAVQGGLTVTPGYTNGTAASGDYTANTTALTFTGTKGETKTFTVSTTEDAVLEANETFTVGLTVSNAPTGTTVTATDTGTGTINNDDSAAVTINDVSASEGESMTFTVTLSEAVQGGLTVTPGYTNGTAASGDYTANTTALSFSGTKGETETFTVSTTEDAVVEANETFTVGLTVSNAPTGTTVTATDTGTGTINNDDSAAVTINHASASEGESMTFTVTLDKAVQGGLKVTPGYTNGTAASGDYTANTTALTFTGTANETKTFTVSTTEDAVVEDNETFTVGLSVSNAPSEVTATDTGIGTINDDDSTAVRVNDAAASEGDGISFTVTLSAAVQGGLKVTPSYTNGTAASTDYTANTTALSFTGTKGETKTFTVSTTEDAVVEANETFTVGLTVSGTTLTVTATDTGTGTINNDDGTAVTVNDANASEGDGISFTVTLSAAVQGGLTVTPSFTDVTAVAGTDYTANTTALTFTGTANETKTFTVSTTEDAAVEADETFTVGLTVSDAPTGTTVTATDTGTGAIDNDDSAAVTVNDADADEGDGISFTVTLSVAVQGGLKVTPSFDDVTAVEGTDYTKNTAALTFTGTANETKTFTVSTTEDAVVEAAETFTVKLSVSDAPTGVTADDTATGTINNNDSAEVTVEDAEASEGDAITFTVTLSVAVQGGLKVTPSFDDVTAVEGTDYTKNTAALTFTGTANETKTFTVSTTEDAVLEAAETFTVGLEVSDAPTGTTVTATDTGTGTINNDDSAAVTVNDPQKTEEGKSMTFTVTLDTAVQGGLTVTVTVGDTKDSATSGTDYDYDANTTALSFTGTANETKTFAVSTKEDTVVEGDETFTVGLSVSDTTVTATDTGTGTIEDQTATEIDLSVDPSEVAENAGATDVTVTASTKDGVTFKADQTVTVTVGDSKDTATSGTDYAAVADFDLTITAGETSGTATFTLTPTDDILIEDAETLTVSGSSATGLTMNQEKPTLTLTDDDTAVISQPLVLPPITLSASPASVSEGAPGTKVTVTATVGDGTVAFDKAKTVTLTVGNRPEDTATPGTDYAEVTDTITLTIPAEAKTATGKFTLTPTNDSVVELDEALTVSGTSPDLDVADTKVTLTDDDTATLTVSDGAGLEGEALAFALTLSQPVPEAVTLAYTTQDGTATVADEDYVPATTGSLTLSPGTTTGTLTVPTTEDPMVEPDETFTVTVSAAGSRVDVSEPVATGTIQNDDVAHVHVSNIEGVEGETLTFTVTLSAPVYTDVVLAYTTQDGTATVADDDYVPATTGSRLTVPARATTEQTAVQTIADGLLEDDETFTVQLRLTADTVDGVVLGPAPASAGTVQAATHTPDHVDGTGTILNNDEAVRERLKRVQTPILADLSLAMTDSVVRAVTARLAQAATQRCARGMTVPGPPADPNADLPRSNGPLPDTTPSLRDVLAGSSFVFSLSGSESTKDTDPAGDTATPACGENQRPLTLWGQGDLRALSGQQRNGLGEAVGWDGNVVGGLLGLDLPVGATGLAGLGVSHFQSAFDYQYTTPRGKTVPGTYETTMTSLHPYAKWAPWAETSLWLTGGYGRGEVTMTEDKLGEQTADSWWATLAAGGLVRLSPDVALLPGGATTVDLKTEAWLTRFQVEDNADFLKDLSVHTHRLRLAVVGEHTWELESGGVLTPLLEFGVRRDGGDGVTGLGVEIGGRVGYVDPSGRFTVEGRGHVLTAHEGGKDEWGAGGVIRLAPQADGHGLWFNVLPSYGDVQSGAERLWEQGVTRPAGAAAPLGARVEAQLGYGVPALAGRGVVTPYGGLVFSGAGERTYAVGTRLALRSGLVCSLEGTRGTRGVGAPENYGVLLRLDFSW